MKFRSYVLPTGGTLRGKKDQKGKVHCLLPCLCCHGDSPGQNFTQQLRCSSVHSPQKTQESTGGQSASAVIHAAEEPISQDRDLGLQIHTLLSSFCSLTAPQGTRVETNILIPRAGQHNQQRSSFELYAHSQFKSKQRLDFCHIHTAQANQG